MKEKAICVISGEESLPEQVKKRLDGMFRVSLFSKIEVAIDHIYSTLPDLVILHIREGSLKLIEIINDIKSDPIFSRIPVLLIMPAYMEIDWKTALVEDYIYESSVQEELKKRAELTIIRAERAVEVNPLTRLPGNISINREIQNRIDRKEIFALAYADIDQFKPFNDKYGFGRGDEVIKAAGRIIMNIVRKDDPKKGFIGHVGGDDFVYITNPDIIEKVSDEIISNFSSLVPIFYDAEDVKRGFIISKDRQGVERNFPIMSLSIGIVHNRIIPFYHYGEIIETASRMKSLAKKVKGGCWRMDRRKS